MKKAIKTVIGFLVIGTLISFCTESCKTKSMAMSSPVERYYYYSVMTRHDSIPKVVAATTHGMSPEQYQAYLQKFYDNNYNKSISPQFAKLIDIINKQGGALQGLALYQTQTRHRTDSLAHERNYYREEFFKQQKQSNAYQKQVISYLNIHNIENEKDIKINFILATACLVGLLIIIFIVWGLFRIVKRLEKSISHV